jgi:hypothetical protein
MTLLFASRRFLFVGISSVSAVAALCVIACTRTSADARAAAQANPAALQPAPRQAAAQVPDVQIPSAKNRLGINLAGPSDSSSEMPFTDVFRLSRQWISQRKGEAWGKGPALDLDERGWIKRLEPGCYAETPLCTLRPNRFPGGEYVCLYDGDGKIEFNNIKREVGREKGRIVFEPNPEKGGFFLRIMETDIANPIRNIRVLLPGFEKTYKTEPFNPVFLARWKNMNTLRFMDWMKTNGSKIKEWNDRPKMDDATWTRSGVPVETMVELCNRQKIHPWFSMPHLASDDYVRQFAKQVKAMLDPSLTVYIEYSNEVWNSQFEQTRYANAEGQKRGYSDKAWEAGWRFSGVRSVEMFKIWEEVYGGRERLVRVIAGQSANPTVTREKIAFQDVAKSCDAIAIAPYISLNLGPTTKPDAETVSGWTVEQILEQLQNVELPDAVSAMQKNRDIANRYKLRLLCYEAGQHAVGVRGGENNEKLTALLMTANRHERMGQIYDSYLNAWKDTGGGDLMCLFSSVGGWTKWGSWGLIEYNGDDTPKYRATLRWMAANPK